jgi:hypothetical protein
MKRLLAVLTLIVCLSLPSFAGHHSVGGGYCECGPQDCICDPGEIPLRQSTDDHTDDVPTDVPSELAIALLALLLWLRLKSSIT